MLVPLGPTGSSNSSRCSPKPSLQPRGGHPQVTQVSCNASSTAFNWEHPSPCSIRSLSKSFPALQEPRVSRWGSRCESLWPSPAKNPPPPCELRVLLPHPCGAPAPPSPQTGEGTAVTLLQARYSAPQFPSHPVIPLLQQRLNQKQGCSDPNPSHSAPKTTVV